MDTQTFDAVPYPPVEGVRFGEVPGFPGYCVGDDGSVWSRFKRARLLADKPRRYETILGRTWRRLRGAMSGHRRHIYRVTLCAPDGTRKSFSVGALVLTAFVGPRPEGMECCHSPDPNPRNCRLDNVRWDTHAENVRDAIRHGTFHRGERSGGAKLTEAIIVECFEMRAQGLTVSAIAKRVGVDSGHMSRILSGKKWKHTGHARMRLIASEG